MKETLTIACSALVLSVSGAASQQAVPIVTLPPASVKTATTLGAILGVRQVAGGKVLVNDAGRRQIKLFDSTLATSTIVSDSAPGTSTSYGQYATSLVPFLGDSSLFADFQSQTILVLDARGSVARAMSPPNDPAAMGSLVFGRSAVDHRGRLVYLNRPPINVLRRRADPATGASQSSITQPPDSADIFRVDMDTHRVDTVGKAFQPDRGHLSFVRSADGSGDQLRMVLNPLRAVDEWAVLSDGTIAFVRGQDYHVDWIHPDGSKSATGKLPFDWKRLTDDDKQKLADSARAAETAAAAARSNAPIVNQSGGGGAAGGGRGGRGGSGDGAPPAGRGMQAQIDVVPLTDIADYYPPIRAGAAIADLEGNLWILPTTSAQSKTGELIYDVVNPKRGLFERVRMPVGRSVVGFGKGGVVYLMSGDKANGFYLERTSTPGGH